jgi:hypothetical protein
VLQNWCTHILLEVPPNNNNNNNRFHLILPRAVNRRSPQTPETELSTNLIIAKQPPKPFTRVTTITIQHFVYICDNICSPESTLYPVSATTRRSTPQWLTESNPMTPTSLLGERKVALVHKQAGIKEQQPCKR